VQAQYPSILRQKEHRQHSNTNYGEARKGSTVEAIIEREEAIAALESIAAPRSR